MPQTPVNTLHCLILQSKNGLGQIPQGVVYYFVNSKRRFFLYFRLHEQMIETMRVLTSKNIRFYRRASLFPDRQEYEEHVYHCNYRFKKQDLRKNLYHSTPYNEPKVLFDKYKDAKDKFESNPEVPEYKRTESDIKKDEMPPEQTVKMVDERQQKSGREDHKLEQRLKQVLNNKDLLIGIFQALNVK